VAYASALSVSTRMWRRQRILKVIEVPSIVMLDKTTERKSVREPRSGLSPSRGSRPSRSRTACDIGLPQFRCGTETILNFLVIRTTAPDKSVRRAAPVAAGEGPFRSDPRDFRNFLKEPSNVAPTTRPRGSSGRLQGKLVEGQEIHARSAHGWQLHSRADTGINRLGGSEVELEYDAARIASEPSQVEFVTPDGQDIQTTVELASFEKPDSFSPSGRFDHDAPLADWLRVCPDHPRPKRRT